MSETFFTKYIEKEKYTVEDIYKNNITAKIFGKIIEADKQIDYFKKEEYDEEDLTAKLKIEFENYSYFDNIEYIKDLSRNCYKEKDEFIIDLFNEKGILDYDYIKFEIKEDDDIFNQWLIDNKDDIEFDWEEFLLDDLNTVEITDKQWFEENINFELSKISDINAYSFTSFIYEIKHNFLKNYVPNCIHYNIDTDKCFYYYEIDNYKFHKPLDDFNSELIIDDNLTTFENLQIIKIDNLNNIDKLQNENKNLEIVKEIEQKISDYFNIDFELVNNLYDARQAYFLNRYTKDYYDEDDYDEDDDPDDYNNRI